MQYLKRGLLNTFSGIKKHKVLFALLLIVQIVILVLSAYVIVSYQIKIFADTQLIIESFGQANYDAESIQMGQPFLEDTTLLYKSYLSIQKNVTHLILILLLIYVFVNGFLWVMTQKILERKKYKEKKESKQTWKQEVKQILFQWCKYSTSTAIFILPFTFLCYYFLKTALSSFMDMDSLTQLGQFLPYLFLVIYYFMLVAFAFINIKSWKKFTQQFFVCSIKKLHWNLPVLLINFLLLAGSSYLVYYSLEQIQKLSLIMASTILFVLFVVLTRMFWAACLHEITTEDKNEKSNH